MILIANVYPLSIKHASVGLFLFEMHNFLVIMCCNIETKILTS